MKKLFLFIIIISTILIAGEFVSFYRVENNSEKFTRPLPEGAIIYDKLGKEFFQLLAYADTSKTLITATVVSADSSLIGDFYGAISDSAQFALDSAKTYTDINTMPASNYISYVDTVLYVVQKFNTTKDIITTFKSSGNNDLFTFGEVGLYTNTGLVPSKDLARTRIQRFITNDGSDTYPCPIQIDGEFAGGNHLSPNTTNKTAWTESFEIYADDVQLSSGYSGYCDEIIVKTHNEILDPNDIESGYRQVIIDEYCTMKLKGHTIEVETQHIVADTSFLCDNFYGMQSYGYSNADSVYFSHSDNNTWQEDTDAQNSGAMSIYPNVEKWVSKDTFMHTAVQVWIDNNYGLPSNTDTYIDDASATYKAFQSSGKEYFHLIDNVTVYAGTTYGLRGSYSFFDITEQESDNRIIASNMFYRNGKPVMTIDVLDTVSVAIPKELTGLKINESYIDDDVSLNDNVFSSYLKVISDDNYGVAYLEINPFQEDVKIDGKLTIDGTNVVSGLAGHTMYGLATGNNAMSGTSNMLYGDQAGNGLSSGGKNCFFGYQAGFKNSVGSRNTYIGHNTGLIGTSNNYSTFLGAESGVYVKGSYNTALGSGALYATVSSLSIDNNIGIGYKAGYGVNTGADDNIFIGYQCVDEANVTGTNNIMIGKDLALPATTTSNYIDIGGTLKGSSAVSNQYLIIAGHGNEPATPVEGMIYYNTTTHKLRVYNGTIWEDLN